MKLKKYGKGGKYDMYKKGGTLRGKKVTKEMEDKEFKKKFEESANFANKFAKYAETGVGPNGMPLSAKKRKEYAELAKKKKDQSSKMKPNYRYVGTRLPAMDQPVFKKGGKVDSEKKGLEPMVKKSKGYSEKSKKMGVSTLEERRAERRDAHRLKNKYKNGGKINNPDKKVRPEVGRWYEKQDRKVKAIFDNAFDSAYRRGASSAQARESAIRAVEKKLGKPIEFKYGGKMMKYLKGGQAKLDANKDGKISGEDFKMLRAKKK